MFLRHFTIKAATLTVFFCLLVPQISLARGLVPCGGEGEPDCQTCHVVDLAQNVTSWFVAILSIIAAIIIVIAGIQMVTSGGNTAAKTAAKNKMTNMLIGFVLVLGSWLLIDTGLRMLLNPSLETEFGPWNQIQCTEQPEVREGAGIGLNIGRLSASGLNATAMNSTQSLQAAQAIGAGVADCTSANVYEQARCHAAAAGLNAEQQNVFAALVQQESSGCMNMRSPAGAYGCSQLLLGTARSIDPNATIDRLLNDNAYNMTIGAQYYARQLASFGGDTRLALAAYNGGPGANSASRDCPGRRRWECEWDNAAHTVENTGYRETRNYVHNITRTADNLSSLTRPQ